MTPGPGKEHGRPHWCEKSALATAVPQAKRSLTVEKKQRQEQITPTLQSYPHSRNWFVSIPTLHGRQAKDHLTNTYCK